MYSFLLLIHILVCISLIISVLLQSSKGGGLGGAFGGGSSSDTLFGGQGASSFLKKITKVLAIAFMVLSILLALTISARKPSKGGDVSKEIEHGIEESSEEEAPSTLPEGFEVLPEPEKKE